MKKLSPLELNINLPIDGDFELLVTLKLERGDGQTSDIPVLIKGVNGQLDVDLLPEGEL